MTRPIHQRGSNGITACCGKNLNVLGYGARTSEDPAEINCPSFVPPKPPAEGLRLRPGDQQLPAQGLEISVQDQLIGEIEARRQLGIQRYGTQLQPFNGRDALRDLLDELLDGATYAMQVKIERDLLLARIAALEAEIAAIRAGEDAD